MGTGFRPIVGPGRITSPRKLQNLQGSASTGLIETISQIPPLEVPRRSHIGTLLHRGRLNHVSEARS